MSTKRFYSGARELGTRGGAASQLMRMQIQKGGKLQVSSADRYKHIMKQKMAEHRQKAMMNPRASFSLKGSMASFKMSKKAEEALKQIAQKKAMKEAKALRKMVPIVPRNYGSIGRLDKKGNVYDEAQNLVMKVDGKKGLIKTMNGWTLGKYKPKSSLHDQMMRDAILKNSPYHAKLRLMQYQQQVAQMYAMQQSGAMTLHGGFADISTVTVHGAADDGQKRGNIGVGAWGVMSNNVHGTFGENIHGGFADNVWGRASTDIWGGLGGGGSVWGSGKSVNIWRSGKPGQKNYIGIGFKIGAAWAGRFFGRIAGRNLPRARMGGKK